MPQLRHAGMEAKRHHKGAGDSAGGPEGVARVQQHHKGYADARHVEIDEVFKCTPCEPAADGTARCQVFSCRSCRAEKTRDPAKYDLMDGVQATGAVEETGLGHPLPPVLACLSSDERLTLSIVKVIDGAYEDYSKRNGSTSYSRYTGGAFHAPADMSSLSEAYRGMSTLLVRDTPDAPLSETRLKAALDYLMDSYTGNPLLRHTLTCYERELQSNTADQFPHEAGGGGLPTARRLGEGGVHLVSSRGRRGGAAVRSALACIDPRCSCASSE